MRGQKEADMTFSLTMAAADIPESVPGQACPKHISCIADIISWNLHMRNVRCILLFYLFYKQEIIFKSIIWGI